jgi:hypothetical protein
LWLLLARKSRVAQLVRRTEKKHNGREREKHDKTLPYFSLRADIGQ